MIVLLWLVAASGVGATAGAGAGASAGADVLLVMEELLLSRPAVILIVLSPRRFAPAKEWAAGMKLETEGPLFHTWLSNVDWLGWSRMETSIWIDVPEICTAMSRTSSLMGAQVIPLA